MPELPLPVHSYQTRAPRAGVSRLVNCRIEEGREKGPLILYGSEGITNKLTLAKFPQRGSIVFQNKLFVVGGNTLYEISSAGGATSRGTIPGTGFCPMSENGAQLVIVTEPDAYVWNGSTLAQITDPDFTARGALDSTFVDNFILFIEPNSGRFFGSELGDATAYDALDFATAETYPDNLVGLTADHGQVFLAGKTSCELWDNIGGSGFPFGRNFNGVIEQGCSAGRSIVKADQTVFWLDDELIFRRLDGVTPIRVSQHGVEQMWGGYATIDDAEAFAFTIDGHINIAINFPTEEATWIVDLTTNQWHERESKNSTRWRTRWAQKAYGKIWCGDQDTGKVGILDPEVFDEHGDVMISKWTYPSVYSDGDTAFHNRLEIIAEVGVGNADDLDPKIMMEVSDDGGKTFDFLPDTDLGAMGKYRTKVTWWRLGSSDDRVYRGSIADKVRRAIISTVLDVERGTL